MKKFAMKLHKVCCAALYIHGMGTYDVHSHNYRETRLIKDTFQQQGR